MKASAIAALVRPFTLLAPVVGVGSGAVIAAHATSLPWDAKALACGLASALLATAASNAWNQAFDAEIDRVNKPSRPIPSGHASVRGAIVFGHVCALAALALGWLASAGFFACVAAGVLLTWSYSAPPMRTKARPVGALLSIAVARGLLVPVAGWSIIADLGDAQPWTLGAIVGLFVFGAAVTKDFADMEGDRAHACRTLPVLLGPRRTAVVVAPFLVVPFLLYPLASHFGLLPPPHLGWWVLGGTLAVVGLVTAWRLVRAPEGSAGGGNHPVWAAMYVLLLAAHIGSAVVYHVMTLELA